MKRVGLTGGIATGKSHVLGQLRAPRYPVSRCRRARARRDRSRNRGDPGHRRAIRPGHPRCGRRSRSAQAGSDRLRRPGRPPRPRSHRPPRGPSRDCRRLARVRTGRRFANRGRRYSVAVRDAPAAGLRSRDRHILPGGDSAGAASGAGTIGGGRETAPGGTDADGGESGARRLRDRYRRQFRGHKRADRSRRHRAARGSARS